MPNFRVDLVDKAVWDWMRGVLEDPVNLMEGLHGVQEETRRTHKSLYDRLDLIQEQLDDALRQQEKLLDLYLSGGFAKDLLIERKEQEQLTAHLGKVKYTDQDIAAIEEFCAKIRGNLDHATYEGKCKILDLFDAHGTLAKKNGERTLYLTCAIYPQPVSPVRTSPLSNIGATATHSCTFPRTARSR
jgi:hypothetical protein